MGQFKITADSEPLLDTYGWADYWSNEDWEQWVRLNIAKYGKSKAKDKFRYWWNQQDSFAHNYNWSKYDPIFVDFLNRTIEYDISSIASAPLIGIEKAVKGTSKAIGGVGEGLGKSAKVLKYLPPTLLIIAVIIILLILQKKYQIV